MRLKYYLRGLGIGMVVTAVVLSLSVDHKAAAMTDEQIIERAKELGMQEAAPEPEEEGKIQSDKDVQTMEEGDNAQPEANDTQPSGSDTQPGDDDTKTTGSNKQTTGSNKQTTGSDKQTTGSSKQTTGSDKQTASSGTKTTDSNKQTTGSNKQTTGSDKQTADSNKQTTGSDKQTVVVTIRGGDSSFSVSKKVVEAGLTDSASAFDTFLCQNGYDKKLVVGEHKIPVDASEKEIAAALTSGTK